MPATISSPSSALAEAAPAKVNLFLRVVGRRPDGYHALESLAVFAGVGDEIRAEAAETLSLSLAGPFAAGLAAERDNLVLRAARALAQHAGRPAQARLVLDKHLPVASGIGGGSADAAATLRVLARLWGLEGVPPELALKLGADVPVCLGGQPAMMRGVGEALAPAPGLPAFGLALVNPGQAVATADVFRARAGAYSPAAALPGAWPDVAGLARDLAALGNDLQAPALALCPAIADVLAALRALPGCRLAQMSGSGATCFALFDTPLAAAAASGLNGRAGWWAWGGALLPARSRGLPEPASCP